MKYFLPILLISMYFVLPELSLAQAGGLVPCGGADCTTADVASLASNVITFLIAMLGVIAVIGLVLTGLKLVTSAGNTSEWTDAKERFKNIVIGIIIILAAWLVVDTIMKGLTGKGLGVWSDLSVMEAPSRDIGRS